MAGVASPPIVSRVHIIIFSVRDIRRSLGFYRDLLGIPLEVDASDPEEWAQARLADGLLFALHPLEAGRESGSGSIDVEFRVADVASAEGRLRDAGVKVGTRWSAPWGKGLRVEDPDGYRITLFQPAQHHGGES